ncbi:MAG: glycosyltransferase family 2 protein [Anaerolineae bacterium]
MNSTSYQPKVSVVIKTYDNSHRAAPGTPTLKELLVETLRMLEAQTFLPYEVLVVDSSDGDGIAEVLQQYGPVQAYHLRHIPLVMACFSYCHAMNVGVQEAEGEIIASLSGDATPANDRWLETLIAPLEDPGVAGAFSRHIARPGVPMAWAERLRLWWRYHSKSTFVRQNDHVFSNASSAFRRALALEVSFDESLNELEDYAWAGAMQQRGYRIAYVGASEVYHSHTVSSAKTLWRMAYYVYLRARIDAGRERRQGPV